MKKLFAIALVVFGFGIPTPAQNYQVRANRGLNLRADSSLQSRVVDTVRAGDILQVVGSANRWLRIDRNGRIVWLANWTNFSRLDDLPRPVAQPSSQPIDNCCFVDRQCSSNAEWTDGYWAFQNGQCAAPARSQPPSPAQPAADGSTSVDNCCFVDRPCATRQEWTDGYWAFQNRQCPVSGVAVPVAPSRPAIEGSVPFVRGITSGLNWLERKAPEWYLYVISVANRIIPTHTYGSSFARPHDATLLIDGRAYGSRLVLGMVLVHEACHIHRHRAGLQAGGKVGEIACYEKEIAYLQAADPYRQLDDTDVLIQHRRLIIATADDPNWWFNQR